MEEPYKLYILNYGKVQSGTKLEKKDYGVNTLNGFKEFDEKGMLAVSMAAQDVKIGKPMRSKKDFEEQLNILLGS